MKFIVPVGGSRKRFYQFTAIDDYTRLRELRIYDKLNQKMAIQFVDYVLERLPFQVAKVQMDNGTEFASRSTGTCRTVAWGISKSSARRGG